MISPSSRSANWRAFLQSTLVHLAGALHGGESLLLVLAKGEDDLLDPSRLAIADVVQETSLASQLLVGVEIVTVDGTFVGITTWVHCDDGAAELLAVIKRL